MSVFIIFYVSHARYAALRFLPCEHKGLETHELGEEARGLYAFVILRDNAERHDLLASIKALKAIMCAKTRSDMNIM